MQNEQNPCYIFSGLGADERIFEHISFGARTVVFLPWKEVGPKETLTSYARRYLPEIADKHAVIIGISFGGILAQEVSECLGNTNPVLLIASVRTKDELPLLFRWGGKIGLNKLIPIRLSLHLKKVNHFFFGTQTEQEKSTLDTILKETNPQFAKWAIHEIVNWNRRSSSNPQIAQINGANDRIFPIKNIRSTIQIENGTHFMTVSQSELLSTIIQNELDHLEKSTLTD